MELCISIGGVKISEIQDFEKCQLNKNQKEQLIYELLKLMQFIDIMPLTSKTNINDLTAENEMFKRKIQSISFNWNLDKILLEYHSRFNAQTLIDLYLNPESNSVISSEKNVSIEFKVSSSDVIYIKSNGRIKDLYLDKFIEPVLGGGAKKKITTNKEIYNLKGILNAIQGKKGHLIIVNKSIALNLMKYDLAEESTFAIKAEYESKIEKEFHRIKVDRYFDINDYNERLNEIKHIFKSKENLLDILNNIKEMSRYKNKLAVTI